MKKTFTLSIVATFLVIYANAQINKGSVLFGGTLNFYTDQLKNSDSVVLKSNNFSITPSIGFAVDTNTIVGVSLFYGNSNNKGFVSFEQKSNTYGAGIFARRYKPISKNFYLYAETNLMFDYTSYNYSEHIYNQSEYDSKAFDINLNISPGVAYSLTHCIQLEAGLQNLLSVAYTHRKEDSKDNAYTNFKENNFTLSSSLNPVSFGSVFIGLQFLFNK